MKVSIFLSDPTPPTVCQNTDSVNKALIISYFVDSTTSFDQNDFKSCTLIVCARILLYKGQMRRRFSCILFCRSHR